MTLLKALLYFLRTAGLNLLRSWKVSMVAVVTIGVSLFVGGAFLLLSSNMSQLLESWRAQVKVVLYLTPEASAEDLAALANEVAQKEWVIATQEVSHEEALLRFRELFPSLSDLVEGWDEEGGTTLPASLEIAYRLERARGEDFTDWLEEMREKPEVAMVDDDRDWLEDLAALLALARGLGLTLGLVLLAAAVFTIASVVRLTAYLYHDEISIMRLVGATEFFIRGPFYAEGLLQGLLGGLAAALGLYGSYMALHPQLASSAWASLFLRSFLSPFQLGALVALGAAAGLFGAIVSLRREKLGQSEEAAAQ